MQVQQSAPTVDGVFSKIAYILIQLNSARLPYAISKNIWLKINICVVIF
jgi:hypothetical protein